MEPIIKTLTEKKLIGMRMIMTFANNKTGELWRSFMPRRKEIKNNVDTNHYSMQIYAPMFFDNFNLHAEYEKWATTEVTDFNTVPNGMETFLLPGGLYAVFLYQGPASEGAATFQYIFGTWLPNSIYILDNRPHFEILGEKYKNEDLESEEELWIPIKLRQ